jgi:hypothetical protein
LFSFVPALEVSGSNVQKCGLGNEPGKVLDKTGRIKLADVVLPTTTGIKIRLQCVSKPEPHQKILLQYLGLKMPERLTKDYKI